MRSSLERYVRSLAERELAGDAPETMQDLGTFVDWLVERLGYTVHLRAFKYAGLGRQKSAGRLQLGVDMLATKPDAHGRSCLYRFVLKAGPVTKADWGRYHEEGNIVHDVRLAATRSVTRDQEDFAFGGEQSTAVAVVAVHNGDFDAEALGGSRAQLRDELAARSIQLEWWDAGELVRLAEPLISRGADGEDGCDAGLFPPGVRPFARLAIDSVRRDARSFDYRAVDEYLEARLPLGRKPRREGAREVLDPGTAMDALALARRAAEVPLFAAMLVAESRTSGKGLTLPALDTLERCICRVAEQAQRHTALTGARHLESVKATLRALLQQYVDVTRGLRQRLLPIQAEPFGLGIGSLSERVDYPLRCYRLLGHLAVAGLASLDEGIDREARCFADVAIAIWKSNNAACESPVTDDQVIELAALWSLMLRLGRSDEVGAMATGLVNRLAMRRYLGLPLPGLRQQAGTPMSDGDLRVLAAVHTLGPTADAQFVDDSSTLVTVATYLGYRHGNLDVDGVKRLRLGAWDERGRELIARCSFQLWQPPSDAAGEWYANEIAYRGNAHDFASPQDKDAFVVEFEDKAGLPRESYARAISLPVIDVVAWKRWRTLPDPSVLVTTSSDAISAPAAS